MPCRIHLYYKVGAGRLGGILQHITKPFFTKRKHKERFIPSGSVKRKGKCSNVTPITWKQIPRYKHPRKLRNNLDVYHLNAQAFLNSISSASLFISYTLISLHFCLIFSNLFTSDSFLFALTVLTGTCNFIASYRKHLRLHSHLQCSFARRTNPTLQTSHVIKHSGYVITLRRRCSNALYKRLQQYACFVF
jgi:hypothetical protein